MFQKNKIKILITGIGAPGAPGIIKSLRLNNERDISIIGVDSNVEYSIGKGMVDKYFSIPSAEDPTFIEELKLLAISERVQIILPLVTKELFLFSKYKNEFEENKIKVLVSDFESLKIANNKYNLMCHCENLNIPVPKFKLVNNIQEFKNACTELGYPQKKICFKPPISNGLRGFRILEDNSNKMVNLINEKPDNVFISYDEFIQMAQDSAFFPELLVMEYLPGQEYSVDALGDGSRCVKVIPRVREKIKMGISFVGITSNHEKIIQYSKSLIDSLKLFGNIGFQFREDGSGIPKIIESNPRVQGTIILCTAAGYNMVYNAVKIALDEEPIDSEVKWNLKMIRYWDELFFDDDRPFRI